MNLDRNARVMLRIKLIGYSALIAGSAYLVDTLFDFLSDYEERFNPVTEIHSYRYSVRNTPSIQSMLLDKCIEDYQEGAPRYWCRQTVEGVFQ